MVQVTAARGWEFDVERGPNCLFVCPSRPNEEPSSRGPLCDEIWALLEKTLNQRLVLDLSKIGALDDELIAQLAQLHRRIVERDGMMRLCGLSAHDEKRLAGSELEEQIAHYCSREAALMGQTRAPRPR